MNASNQKTVSKQPMQFDTAQLEQRQQQARDNLLTGEFVETSTGGFYRHPCQDTEAFNNLDQFLSYIESKALQGIKRYEHIPPVVQGMFYSVSHYKSDTELQALFEESDKAVEHAYRAEIESWNQAQIDILTQQLFAQAKAKEEKAARDKEQKQLAEAKAEAEKYIQSLLETK